MWICCHIVERIEFVIFDWNELHSILELQKEYVYHIYRLSKYAFHEFSIEKKRYIQRLKSSRWICPVGRERLPWAMVFKCPGSYQTVCDMKQ